MDPENLSDSLKAIEYGQDLENQGVDEQSIRWLLESVVYRRLGDLENARELLTKVIETPTPKGTPYDEWMGKFSFFKKSLFGGVNFD